MLLERRLKSRELTLEPLLLGAAHVDRRTLRWVDEVALFARVAREVVQLQRPPVVRMVAVRLVVLRDVCAASLCDRLDARRVDEAICPGERQTRSVRRAGRGNMVFPVRALQLYGACVVV